MILTQHNGSDDLSTCALHESERPPIPIVAHGSPLDFDEAFELKYDRRFFCYADQHIHLEKDLIGEAFLNVGVMRIKGWGVQFHLYDDANVNIDRLLVRKFLDLYGKAENGRLDDTEKEEWMSVVSQVDYQRFCAERSPELYMEGKLLARDDHGWLVRWHDGTEQQIDESIGRALDILDPEQRFGAMVRIGKGNTVASLRSISFVAEPELTSENLWQSWPIATS